MDVLLSPPFAFLAYVLLVWILLRAGRWMAPSQPNAHKSSPYASGEQGEMESAVPGYAGFSRVALFFAILHLGVVVLATAGSSPMAVVYLLGLMVALLALILG